MDFSSKSGVDTLEIEFRNIKTNYKSVSPAKKYEHITINGIEYDSVLNIKNAVWFAPNIGLIKYVSFDERDTFYLNKCYLTNKISIP
jgi:hypothetical protein